MKLFGVWYDDGHLDFGWLAQEGGNGRVSRAEYFSLEEAERAAEMHRTFYKDGTVFHAAEIGTDEEKLAKRVHKLAMQERVRRAKSELARAEAALEDVDD